MAKRPNKQMNCSHDGGIYLCCYLAWSCPCSASTPEHLLGFPHSPRCTYVMSREQGKLDRCFQSCMGIPRMYRIRLLKPWENISSFIAPTDAVGQAGDLFHPVKRISHAKMHPSTADLHSVTYIFSLSLGR